MNPTPKFSRRQFPYDPRSGQRARLAVRILQTGNIEIQHLGPFGPYGPGLENMVWHVRLTRNRPGQGEPWEP